MEKASQVEIKIRQDNSPKSPGIKEIPPPPTLLHRGATTMLFKPHPFKPKSGEEVKYFCLYLRNAAGNNVKVRLSDTKFKGTGEMVKFLVNSFVLHF